MADDEINVGRRWNDIALVNILDLYGVGVSWRILFVIQTLDTHSHQTPSPIVEWMSSQRKTNQE
jgi:hypothetical protein